MNKSDSNRKEKSRVLVVDDHPIVRYGVMRILNNESDLVVCGEAESAIDAMDCIKNLRPDIVVLDISLRDMDGLQLVKRIRRCSRKLPIVILSMHDEEMYAHRALRAGANGYVMKDESYDKLVTAIRTILGGDTFVSEKIRNNILNSLRDGKGIIEPEATSKLSDREREVFLLLGIGYTTRTIADKLRLSIKTIETHRARIKEKLGLDSRVKLTMAAMEWAKRENFLPS